MNAIYVSANSFKVSGDLTDEFVVGRRVKMVCGVDGTKYATVVSASFAASYTTITVDESELTALLTDVYYGIVSPGNTGSLPKHNHDGSEGSGGPVYTSSTFVGLIDTPSTYSGTEGQYLQSTGSGTVWATVSGGGGGTSDVQNFLDLTDTPSTYSGSDGKYLISTGSGIAFAIIEGPPITFSGLSDTPSYYDEGKYLRSTASGTEWAAAATSGTDDHSHAAYVPWNFGSGTISGTGDIYCNDIYTASGTVYIGDLQLSTDGSNLLVDGAIISGTQGPQGPQGPAGDAGLVESGFKAYELIQEWNLDGESINTNIAINGDVDDILMFHYDIQAVGGNVGIRYRFNEDSGNNYNYRIISEYNDTADTHVGTIDNGLLGYTNSGTYTAGHGFMYLTAGQHKTSVTFDNRQDPWVWSRHAVRTDMEWTSITTVTDINLYTDNTVSGVVSLYKFKNVALPTTFSGLTDTPDTYDDGKYLRSTASGIEWAPAIGRGKQSMQVEYATASGIYINPGDIHMKNSVYDMYELSARTEVSFDFLAADTWYYIYVNVSGSNRSLVESDFIASSEAPVIDYSSMGYYDGNNRCIGAILTDGSNNIKLFYSSGQIIEYDVRIIDLNSSTVSDGWDTVSLTAPQFSNQVLATFRHNTYNSNGVFYYRTYGSSGLGHEIIASNTSGRVDINSRLVRCDNSQRIEVRFSVSSSDTWTVYTNGYYLPDYVYTGA